jgi:peptidylprolyl isomerase
MRSLVRSPLPRPTLAAPAGAVALLLVSALAAGCSSSAKPTAAASATPSTSAAAQALPASDEFGKRARIDIPAGNPSGKLDVKVKVQGQGATVTTGSLLVLNFTGKLWRGAKDLGSSYDKAQGPVEVVEGQQGQMLQGWSEALLGKKAGSRIEVVVPPDKGFGAQGTKDGNLQITGTDTLVFDIDIFDVYTTPSADIPNGTPTQADASLPQVSGAPDGATAPKITIPAGKTAPTQAVYKTLIQGGGRTVAANDTLVVQYEGVLWRTGQQFDQSFGKKPFATAIGQGMVVTAWDEGLIGQKVGSRVLLVVPPDKGYGANPPQGSGITATDTMVFVVDILDSQATG